MRYHANSSVEDGLPPPFLVRLAGIGSTDGDRNCSRKLEELLFSFCGISQLIYKAPDAVGVTDVILPSVLFPKLVGNRACLCKHLLGGNQNRVLWYWTKLMETAEGRELCSLNQFLAGETAHDLRFTVPLRLHEDGGPYTKNKSTYILQWSSKLGKGHDLQTRYLYSSYVKLKGDWCR